MPRRTGRERLPESTVDDLLQAIGEVRESMVVASGTTGFRPMIDKHEAFLELLRDTVRPPGEKPVRIENTSRWASRIGYDHRREILESKLAVSRFLDGDGFTPYGKAWIAYMARRDQDALPAALLRRARDLIVARQRDGWLRYAWGTLSFPRA